jgi:monoamine oxidase
VLEARDRIGGRIFTRRVWGEEAPVELGAEFLHGRPHEVWEIVERAGLRTHEVAGERWNLEQGRLVPSSASWQEIDGVFLRMDAAKPDESFADFLEHSCDDITERSRLRAIAYVEGFHASDARRISVHSLIRWYRSEAEIEGYRGFRFLDGLDTLAHALVAVRDPNRLTLHLSTAVTDVVWRKGTVELNTQSLGGKRGELYRVPAAVVTLPLGVLRAHPGSVGAVRFVPQLAAKTAALDELEMGPAIRLVLTFRDCFWADETLVRTSHKKDLANMSFLSAVEECFPAWWTSVSSKHATLTGWAAGPRTEQLSGRGEPFIVERGLETLSRIFEMPVKTLRFLLHDFQVHDWQADPYSRGAYSYALVGGENAARVLAGPLDNTLFFAGEATDFAGNNGTIHGALASGRRAAGELLGSARSGA